MKTRSDKNTGGVLQEANQLEMDRFSIFTAKLNIHIPVANNLTENWI